MANDREHLRPDADQSLNRLKYEVAEELGLRDDIEERGWENMTTREVGKIGGNMVKRMIAFAEDHMDRRSAPATKNQVEDTMDDSVIEPVDRAGRPPKNNSR